MIGLKFTFPAGRYHATPWGRHVNEGDIAWPPEPYRILRALIATWHRKADRDAFPIEGLGALIDALSEVDPIYRLPESVHAHTRHYMPQGSIDGKSKREKTSLVIDAFLRIEANDPLLAGWDIELGANEYSLLSHLADQMTYFGRAESIVISEAFREWPADAEANARLRAIDAIGVIAPDPVGLTAVDILAPIKSSEWTARRNALLSLNQDKPESKGRKTFEATIPERLVDALSVDTAAIQAAKWSAPPAGRLVLYDRPPLTPTPTRARSRAWRTERSLPTVARFVLAGKPRPSIFDTVKIAETMRLAAMAKWGWEVAEGGRRRPKAPAFVSGRDQNGASLKDARHLHAFWLPEDADHDGLIDHVVVVARHGFDQDAREKLSVLTHLWIEHGAPDDDGERGRKEWRLALEGFGKPQDFVGQCSLLRSARSWRSITPYMRPRFGPATPEETEAQIRRELEVRGFTSPSNLEVGSLERPQIELASGKQAHAVRFRRTRSRSGLAQPDTLGCSVRIDFDPEIEGPLALGFGAHFGLGLFVPVAD
jgi:CRISPR-associated protein Csb2